MELVGIVAFLLKDSTGGDVIRMESVGLLRGAGGGGRERVFELYRRISIQSRPEIVPSNRILMKIRLNRCYHLLRYRLRRTRLLRRRARGPRAIRMSFFSCSSIVSPEESMRPRLSRSRSAFTLIELLVVIAIIAIL